MNVTLLVAAGLLATVALVGGLTKAFVPRPKLAAHSGGEWVEASTTASSRRSGSWSPGRDQTRPAGGLDIAPVMVPVTAPAGFC